MSSVSFIFENLPLAAHKLLVYKYSSLYNSLLDDPTSSTWYIDDRANPKDFWALLTLAQPQIVTLRCKKLKKTNLKKALDILFKPESIEILSNENFNPDY